MASIVAGSCLGFCDDEFPLEGKTHNKELHILIKCVDTVLSKVLVDIGSSLNVIPNNSLKKMTMEGLLMKPNTLVVRGFNGSRKSVIGEVDLSIKIGPHALFIIFYVMDIHLAYSCLLGRPWIHSVGAVTSTLHRKLKFIVNVKMIIIEGE